MRGKTSDVLTKFGISPTSAKVYTALLELGKASADKLAKRAGTYKANVYDALDRLIEVGMASYVIEGRKKLYIPTSPEKLVSMAEAAKQQEVARYDELKSEVQKFMPLFLQKYRSSVEKDIFEIYRGKKGFVAVVSEIIKEKPRYWKGFGNLQIQEFFPSNFMAWFKNVKMMLFAVKSDTVLKRMRAARRTTRVQMVWLPEELYMPVVWTIFGDNLLIIVYEPDIIILRIKSDQIVKTFSDQFDYLWKRHRKLRT